MNEILKVQVFFQYELYIITEMHVLERDHSLREHFPAFGYSGNIIH